MKKYLAIIIIISFTACASMPGVRGDNFANNAPTQNYVHKKAESDHWWDVTKIILGTGLDVLGKAILLNNYW